MIIEPRLIRPEFSYKGSLSEHPLPEILFTINQYRVPGVLTFTHKHECKRLFLRDGNIIFAASNLKEDELGDFLLRCGKIDRVQYAVASRILKDSKRKRIGQILVEMNAIQQSDLNWAVRAHQQSILWSLFSWNDGTTVFNIGNFKQAEPILLELTIPRAIIDGIRNMSQAKRIIGYVGTRKTLLEQDPDAQLALELYSPDESEREILRMVDGLTTLYEICSTSAHGPHETAKILYAFWILKLIRRKDDIHGVRIESSLTPSRFA
jgi:two-component system, OmpR family, response regulator